MTGYEYQARYWSFVLTWLESVVGFVLSGYLRDQNETLITGASTIIITSTTKPTFNQMGYLTPATGFYQLLVKVAVYDGRHLIIPILGKDYNLSYKSKGLPTVIDGTTTLISPQDLHFWRPDNLCGKSVAYVGSLVTY